MARRTKSRPLLPYTITISSHEAHTSSFHRFLSLHTEVDKKAAWVPIYSDGDLRPSRAASSSSTSKLVCTSLLQSPRYLTFPCHCTCSVAYRRNFRKINIYENKNKIRKMENGYRARFGPPLSECGPVITIIM